MERNQNLAVISDLQKQQAEQQAAAQVMQKCTRACFMSMQEANLLPTEERCLTNCFIKSGQFSEYFGKELAYVMRNMKSLQQPN